MHLYDWLHSGALPLSAKDRPHLAFDPLAALAVVQGDPRWADGFREASENPSEASDAFLDELARWLLEQPPVWRLRSPTRIPA